MSKCPLAWKKIIHTIEVGDLLGVSYRTCVLMIVCHVNMCVREIRLIMSQVSFFTRLFYWVNIRIKIRINTYIYTHTHIYIYENILEHIHIDIHVFTYSLRQLEDAVISFIGFSGSLKGPGH